MSDYRKRIDGLKSIEVFCYSLCIHLLAEEALATVAAKATLLDLYDDEQFWLLEGTERDKRIRRQAISRSIELAAQQRFRDRFGKQKGSAAT
ncbi:hypothetical protein [Cohnella silvisoli]|uniref:Uncharacterized protein n=1 Tax=Cohnella silvisoli TaxID=2873699 RepID=A0ABV1KSU7_9BACL|nr:hypothetical protein [Cohnella silvisoli]MCD9021303.1 hypothetical protein [Cohnella silvisoli]